METFAEEQSARFHWTYPSQIQKKYAEFGIYATKGECMELIIAVPLRIDMFAKPEWGCAKAWTVK